ncbi:hypothetical protein LEP1GSC036_3254 [Leptospira weilii str. 2006001853]|uniref:Uncharacterized protein n=3 Tax=Leptospira weilii TaxID=28184 RepID=A0A828Z524_9LEPT|nr:hypothetical protein LEP1GSC036_3254 [Leptospira weilii str. 2006001853]EMM73774.1 hypothetical protein LEP1GSC038_3445 [Leptospira weilii str. 2006001855]EMN89329.1 hypothetical protein LEP1GSC108_4419 [Leptospira weilii str. UI 13098]OMI17599.1 hypothetical protein BUQ74_09250 [Leptospira weilii serovar Heyan]QDK22492.1 hypothetical protein FHG67_07005 [Leptospira weilii]
MRESFCVFANSGIESCVDGEMRELPQNSADSESKKRNLNTDSLNCGSNSDLYPCQIEPEWTFRLFFLDFGGQSENLSSTGRYFHVSIIKSA